MSTTTMPTAKVHPWESCGLGRAPFKFLGMTENVYAPTPDVHMPGGTCAYCGQGIRYECLIASDDGKRFTVGCDCVRKVHSAGVAVLTDMERAERDLKRTIDNARKTARIKAAQEALAADPTLLVGAPSPWPWFYSCADAREAVERMFKIAGLSGSIKAARVVEQALTK